MQILFDIGGSKIRIAKSVDGQTIQDTQIFETPKSFDGGLKKIVSHIESLANGETISGIAGGIAGMVDKERNELIASINLENWVNQGLMTKLSQHFNCPAILENDAAVGALGEAVYGAGKNHNSVIYFALGTGIGGAWVLKGKLQNDKGTFEPGHQLIDFKSEVDFEELLTEEKKNQELREKYLAVGLHNALMFWPADLIVLGGGRMVHYEWSLDNVKQMMQDMDTTYNHKVEIVLSELQNEAGLYGALQLLK